MLPPLKPTDLLPERFSPRAQQLLELKRVDYVDVRESIVNEADGARYYVVNVYWKLTQSHIPTNQTRRACPHPDVQSHHRLSEFVKLIGRIYDEAQESHRYMPCSFCIRFIDYVLIGKPVPSMLDKFFKRESTICGQLTQFLNEMLDLSRRVKTYDEQCQCDGQQNVPMMVKQFLLPDHSTSSML